MTTMIVPSEAPQAVVAGPIPYHFTVDQYHRMIDAGVFDNTRCELLEGLVVEPVTHNPAHGSAITRLSRRLARLLSDEWLVRVQLPITMSESEPEPDVSVARGPEERYDARHPAPADVSFVCEVADTSLAQDQTDKHRIYAGSRIPVYWIVNLVDAQIEVYTSPRAGKSPAYRGHQDYSPGDSIPVLIAGREIGRLRVRELLP